MSEGAVLALDEWEGPGHPGIIEWSGRAISRRTRHEATMGKVYDRLDDSLVSFIGRQHVFFVGTAPISPEGHLGVRAGRLRDQEISRS